MPVKDLSLEKTSHGTSFLIVFSFHLLYHAVFFINYLFLRLQEFLLMDFMLGAIGKCICVLVRSWHRLFTLQDRNSFISHIMVGELGTWAVGLYLLLVQPYRRSFVSGLMSYLLLLRNLFFLESSASGSYCNCVWNSWIIRVMCWKEESDIDQGFLTCVL